MPTFQYSSMDAGSPDSASVIDAPDRAAALRLLRQRGITPTRVEPVNERRRRVRGHAGEAPLPAKGRMSRGETASFIRELSTAVQAGLPLVQGLKTIHRQVRAPGQKAVIGTIIHEVEHGRSLADAMKLVGRTFSELTVNLTRAGEASGRLGEILEQTADLLDREIRLRRKLLSGLIYPGVIAGLIVIAVGVVSGFIVPQIMKPFEGKVTVDKLPFPTRVLTTIGDGFANYWWLALAAVVVLVFALRGAYRTPSTRLTIDRMLLKVPIAGKVVRDVAVARFTRTLGTLVTAGLPALQALRVTKGTLGNRAMEQVIDQVCEQVSGGKTIADPMERSGVFPPLLTQIIGLGERSGRLPQMLLQAARVFEERTDGTITIFLSTFPMLMILAAAPIVGFVMLAVILPLMQMQDLIQQ